MPNTQPNQNNQSSGQNKQPGLEQQDKVGSNIRKDEPTANKASGQNNQDQTSQRSGQRAGGGM
jgi:hypothetical protein